MIVAIMQGDNAPTPDLLTAARELAGANPQYALLVSVASARLRRFKGRGDRIAEIADFAAEAVVREEQSVKLFVADMRRRLASPAAQAQIEQAISANLPGESDIERNARIGAAYASKNFFIPVHRAGSALWAALQKKGCAMRPLRASDAELFAALGLLLAVQGMSWRPQINGRLGIKGLMDEGESAVRSTIEGGLAATKLLIDAAECIYGWQHLKPKPAPRVEWRRAFIAMLPEFAVKDGRFIPAKDAAARFAAKHPQFKDKVGDPQVFKSVYIELQKHGR